MNYEFKHFLSKDEIAQYSRVSLLNSLLTIGWDWGLILLLVFLSAQISVYFYPLIAVLIARQQHALAVIMHEASHFNLCRHKKTNDLLCTLFCTGPLFYNLKSLRFLHQKHHQNMVTEKDPDYLLYKNYPQKKVKFFRKLVTDLTAQSYPKIFYYFNFPKKDASLFLNSSFLAAVVVNLVIFCAFTALTGSLWAYPFLWLLPQMTILSSFLRIRAVVEHGGLVDHNESEHMRARSVYSKLYGLLLGPHHIGLHFEHHHYPSIPFNNLPKAHAKLLASGLRLEHVHHDLRFLNQELIS